MTNNAYAKNNGDGLLCSILCQKGHSYVFWLKENVRNFFTCYDAILHGRTGRKKLGGRKEICPTFLDYAQPVPKNFFPEQINFEDLPPPPVAKKISVSVPF
jgi:hypothetical protein